jgi:hypothetical protein
MSQPLQDSIHNAFDRFFHGLLAFNAGREYLYKLEIIALRGEETVVKAAHSKFVLKLSPHYKSPYPYFIERSFISFVASFELLLADIVGTVLKEHPKKISQVDFKLADILDAAGTHELVSRAVDTTLNKLMYKKPIEYLDEITSLLSIDKSALQPQWPDFVEAKARRDLGVHNGWRCNATYIRKLREVDVNCLHSEGESLSPHEDEYLNKVASALLELAQILRTAILTKYSSG